MALKYELTSLDELDASLHDLYTSVDDGTRYVLDVEGVKPLNEFNTVYSALQKERNDAKTIKQKLSLFGELEPETVQQQLARIKELEAAADGKIDDSKLESMVAARLNAKLQPVLSEKELLLTKTKEYEEQLNRYQTIERQRRMNDEFTSKIRAAKIDPRFEETVMLKAERLFVETDEGKFLTKEDYLPFEAWLAQQQQVTAFWWGESQGGGSKGSGGSSRVDNPFATGNMTEQAKLMAENPALAQQLAKAAGSKLVF